MHLRVRAALGPQLTCYFWYFFYFFINKKHMPRNSRRKQKESGERPVPQDAALYEKIKKKVYGEIPKHSAYRSGIVVQRYKAAGGK